MNDVLMHISRLFLGVIFLVAGINGYFVIFGLEPHLLQLVQKQWRCSNTSIYL
ncbi:hypothetical protein ACJROX_08390 [Pseudalkalibacillus sp. A8]|uniref:hypothetical protein n=1 Tax=Pseudalkalibacillus sp. A8 TaxID=3382641 RepID=UPI0038B53C14